MSKISEGSISIKESINMRADEDSDGIEDEVGDHMIADDVNSEEIKESIPEES